MSCCLHTQGQGDDALIQRYGLFELSHSNSILEDTVELVFHGLYRNGVTDSEA